MSSKDSHLENSDKVIDRELKSHHYAKAQHEINEFRKHCGGTLSEEDIKGLDKSLKSAGFPNLEVEAGSGKDHEKDFTVSKDAAKTEQQVLSDLSSGSPAGIEAARAAVSKLVAHDGGTGLSAEDMGFINSMLKAHGLQQFKDKNGKWTLGASNSDSSPSGASANPEASTSSAPSSSSSASPEAAPTASDAGPTPSSAAAPNYLSGDSTSSSNGGTTAPSATGSDTTSATGASTSDSNLNVNSKALSSLGSDPSMQAYATQLLKAMNMPTSQANIQFMEAWQKAEGGSPGASGGDAAYNPFNTTQTEAGASSINSDGVKSYTSLKQGITATATTLENGQYGAILSALKSGKSAMADAQAEATTPWGTGSLIEQVLGG